MDEAPDGAGRTGEGCRGEPAGSAGYEEGGAAPTKLCVLAYARRMQSACAYRSSFCRLGEAFAANPWHPRCRASRGNPSARPSKPSPESKPTMSLVAFFIAAFVLAITPGPGMAYVIARTVSSGRSEGLASCLGTGIGGMAHVMAAALGLSVLVAQSAMAFTVIKYIGAAYLIFLGIRILMRRKAAAPVEASAAKGVHRALLEGIVVEIFNVKTALFFLAFLPQFAAPAEPLVPQLVMLGSICVALNTAVDVVAVFAAHRLLASGAAREARARWLTRFSGGTMIGLGVFLGLARREA